MLTIATTEQVNSGFEEMMELITKYISKHRVEKIMKLFDEMFDNIISAPASSFERFHSSYSGGWLLHTLNVMKNAIAVDKLWTESGFGERLYTMEELIFSALMHDIHKIGFKEEFGGVKYIKNENAWKIKNYGQIYETSHRGYNALPLEDAAMMLLQQYDIKLTKNELIGIKCADGAFSENWKQFFPDFQSMLRHDTNIHLVIHQADFMSSMIEHRVDYYDNEK